MAGAEWQAWNHLPDLESIRLLLGLGLIGAVAVVLATAWAVVYWQEHQCIRRPAHRPVWEPRTHSMLSVVEIQQRLAAETGQQPPPSRDITVTPRATAPTSQTDADPDTEPLGPIADPRPVRDRRIPRRNDEPDPSR